MNNPPNILIIGAGAIGGFYGAKLAQAGAEVSVVCRSDYEEVKQNGFHIQSCWDDKSFHFKPKAVLRDVRDYTKDADFILVATKVLQNIDTINLIKPALRAGTSIILMQNGIHIEHGIAHAFPNHHIISILAFVCVSRKAAGSIRHQDYGRLVVGDFPRGVSDKTQHLVTLFQASGVPCEATADVQTQRWQKLVWNAPFNPISVVSGGLNTSEILADAKTRQWVKNVMLEVCLLAKLDGCALPHDIAEKNIEATLNMAPYKTSMLLDFEAGRPMEIEAILGNAVRFAAQKHANTPYLLELYGALQKIASGH